MPLRTPITSRVVDHEAVAEAAVAKRIGRFPYFSTFEGPSEPVSRINGKDRINLGSNNYLGLANDVRVRQAATDAVHKWGAGVTGSRLLNGSLSLHEDLEGELAEFLRQDSALVFPTGYTANLGLLAAVLRPSDLVALDEESHASLVDGVLMARSRLRRFDHNCVSSFAGIVAKSQRDSLCVVEGIYSMRGDAAPVADFVEAAAKADTTIIVDEAHSIGVAGPGGSGICVRDGVHAQVDAVTVTFSKSLGSCGGAIAGPSDLINAIRLTARPFLFTASNTPASLAAALASLRILRSEPGLPDVVTSHARTLRDSLGDLGLNVQAGDGPIVTVEVGSDFRRPRVCRGFGVR